MGRITSSVGLVSGLDYQKIIDSLTAINKQPVDLLSTDLKTRKNQQAAYTGLSATMLSLSLSVNQLGRSSVLDSRTAVSSNDALVHASVDTSASLGSYSFRPVRLAQAQRFMSGGFADATTQTVGAGTITIKSGGFVTTDTSVEALNGGHGFAPGKLRIIDRSGVASVIDLSATRTVGDVLTAINDNGVAAVTASVQGDAIVLADQSGSTSGNLIVQDFGGGTTAADLGIVGSVNSSQLVGTDIVKLGGDLKLSYLNDSLGVRRSGTQDDLRITLKDGGTVDVNLSTAKTVQDVVTAINSDSQNSSRVTASISGDGEKLVLTDTSGGGGTLSVAAINGSKAAQDLGILGSEQAGGVLTGKRILAGLNSVLLKNLNGGSGITTPGQVQITNRNGVPATIDLTNAASLSEVVQAINDAGAGVTAAVNTQGHGITLTDTTGASLSNLIVADLGGGTSAADLHIAGSTASTKIASGDLHEAYINENTLLSSLNSGVGISAGQIKITDKAGNASVLIINGANYKTVGDLMLGINAGSAQVTATLNATGDGILLTDHSGGAGTFSVDDLAGSKSAADLHLRGTGATTIDGANKFTVAIDADDTLSDVVQKLGQSGAPLAASMFNVGGSDGFKLLISAKQSGAASRLIIDSGTTSLNLAQSQAGLDAVLQLSGNGSAPVTFASATNTFTKVVGGVTVDIAGVSSTAVSVSVNQSANSLVDAMNAFVKSFNGIASTLKELTKFDLDTSTAGVLQGDQTAVGMQQALLSLVGKQYGLGGNAIRNFTQVGLTISGGQVTLDEQKLRAAVAADPAAVKNFFGDVKSGASAAMGNVVKSYTDASTGALFNRLDALDNQQKALQSRIDKLNASVDAKKAKLTNQFLLLEKTLASLQSQQSALSGLSNLVTSSKSSSSG